MHDRLFEVSGALETLNQQADAINLDLTEFESCMGSEASAESVRTDVALAGKLGAVATPSFVLARVDPNDPSRMLGIAFIRGARPYADFKSEIDKALVELQV